MKQLILLFFCTATSFVFHRTSRNNLTILNTIVRKNGKIYVGEPDIQEKFEKVLENIKRGAKEVLGHREPQLIPIPIPVEDTEDTEYNEVGF